jgi:aminopeptidase YwaD
MVGEDQDQTGSTWFVERPPEAAASFAPALLAYLRDQLPALKGIAGVASNLSGMGSYPLYRQAESPFSGGSDHIILSDPSVGVPTPMLIQWPDRFYHTSADTPDRTDPRSLARAGALTAAYTYWLATAGGDEATWLGYEMVSRFKTRLVESAQAAVTGAQGLDEGPALADSIAQLDRRLAYAQDRQKAALRTLERLGPVDCLLPGWEAELEGTARHELAWARDSVELRATTLELGPLPDPPALVLSEEEQAAARLIPNRLVPGPVELPFHLRRLDPEDRAAWRHLTRDDKDWSHHTLTALALCWADGDRSLLDIVGLVELETGLRNTSLLLGYFRLLGKLGFVSF